MLFKSKSSLVLLLALLLIGGAVSNAELTTAATDDDGSNEAVVASAGGSQDPVVQLPEYKATGLKYTYQHDGSSYTTHAFLGLPYAKPPVGNLRLEKPQALPNNSTRHVVAKELPPGCVQQEPLSNLGPEYPALYPVSEDCLFLSVMAPKPTNQNKKYPVLVWIHGGGFVYGMSRFYGWQQLARHFNPREVVVVGIQYRIAFWGFFSIDNSIGNLGLYDQTAALKWINTHISKFGGDPTKVTVWGNSAGSASTHSLTLSPLSNQYFRHSIQSSGSLYNLWTHTKQTRKISKSVAQTLGCTSSNTTAVKSCLKTKSIQQIWNATAPFQRMNNAMDLCHFSPAMDEAFYAGKNITQLTKETPVKKHLYGVARGEGVMMTLMTDNPVTSVFAYWLGLPVTAQASYTKQNFTKYVKSYLNTYNTSGENRDEIQDLLQLYYYRNQDEATNTNKFWYYRYTDTQSDGSFTGGITNEIAEKIALTGHQQYAYVFAYVHPSHLPALGLHQTYAPHAYEYQYTTDCVPYFPFTKNQTNSVEKAFTKKLVDGMAQFVKNGNPSTPQTQWPAINHPTKIKHLWIGEQTEVRSAYLEPIAKLWQKIYKLGYGQNTFLD